MDNSTIIPVFLPSVLCIFLLTVLLFAVLTQYPDPEIDIEKGPPNEDQIRKEKKILTNKLKTERNILILFSMPPTIFILYLHAKLYTLPATALTITIATVTLMFPVAYCTSKAAIAVYLEIFKPMIKEHSQQLLEWCSMENTCDQYRLAVLSQGRHITMAEYESTKKWIEQRKERENTQRQEGQYRRLYQNKPITQQGSGTNK